MVGLPSASAGGARACAHKKTRSGWRQSGSGSFVTFWWCSVESRFVVENKPARPLPRIRVATVTSDTLFLRILRKEVIQPQVPLRLPCYDLVPIVELTFGACVIALRSATSGPPNFRGLTGGVYKAQEHIHRSMLTYDY